MEDLTVGIHISMEASITAFCSDGGDVFGVSITLAVDIYIFSKTDYDLISENSSNNAAKTRALQYLNEQMTALQQKYDTWGEYLETKNKENKTVVAYNWNDVKDMISPIVQMGASIRDEINDLLLDTDNTFKNKYKNLRMTELTEKYLVFEADCVQIVNDLAVTFHIGPWDLRQAFELSDEAKSRITSLKRSLRGSNVVDIVSKRAEISKKINDLSEEIISIKSDRNEAKYSIPELETRVKELSMFIETKNSFDSTIFENDLNCIRTNHYNEAIKELDMILKNIGEYGNSVPKRHKSFMKNYISYREFEINSYKNEFTDLYDLNMNYNFAKTDSSKKLIDEKNALLSQIDEINKKVADFDSKIAKTKVKLEEEGKKYEEIIANWPKIVVN